jgi:hypothetical protein
MPTRSQILRVRLYLSIAAIPFVDLWSRRRAGRLACVCSPTRDSELPKSIPGAYQSWTARPRCQSVQTLTLEKRIRRLWQVPRMNENASLRHGQPKAAGFANHLPLDSRLRQHTEGRYAPRSLWNVDVRQRLEATDFACLGSTIRIDASQRSVFPGPDATHHEILSDLRKAMPLIYSPSSLHAPLRRAA